MLFCYFADIEIVISFLTVKQCGFHWQSNFICNVAFVGCNSISITNSYKLKNFCDIEMVVMLLVSRFHVSI